MRIRSRCCLALPLTMALASCQSPGVPEEPATPPGTTPATTDSPTARWRCEVLLVTSRFPEGEVELSFSGRKLTLPQVRSGSGIRYADDGGNEFRSKGESARLTLAGEPPRDCTITTHASPWGKARERGVAFRAVGNEPGWWVEVDHGDSPALRALLDYGERNIVVTQTQGISSTPGFGGRTADGTDAVLRIRREPCSDDMSGEALEAHAELTVGDKTYEGCGAWLDD